MSPRPSKCLCGKVFCRSLDHARTIYARIWAEHGGEPIRYYQCEHGTWHWTRMTEPPTERAA